MHTGERNPTHKTLFQTLDHTQHRNATERGEPRHHPALSGEPGPSRERKGPEQSVRGWGSGNGTKGRGESPSGRSSRHLGGTLRCPAGRGYRRPGKEQLLGERGNKTTSLNRSEGRALTDRSEHPPERQRHLSIGLNWTQSQGFPPRVSHGLLTGLMLTSLGSVPTQSW